LIAGISWFGNQEKTAGRAAERPVGVDGAARARAGHLVPQGPLERRPCSPSTNCTAPGPRTAARADRRTGERVLGAPVARAGRALHGRSARAPARGTKIIPSKVKKFFLLNIYEHTKVNFY